MKRSLIALILSSALLACLGEHSSSTPSNAVGDGDGGDDNNGDTQQTIATLDVVAGDVPGDRFVTTGVPLADGVLFTGELDTLAVFDADGTQMLAQFETRATYPDSGAIRWLGVDLIAGSQAAPLQLKKTTATATQRAGVVASWSGDSIVVNTGPRTYSFNQQTEFISNYFETTDGRRFAGVIDDLEIEVWGPVHSVARIDGHYEHAGTQRGLFSMRLHFFAGLSEIRVDHTFTWTGSHLDLQIDELGVSVAAGSGVVRAHYDPADGAGSGFTTVELGGEPLALYQESARHMGHGVDSFVVEHGGQPIDSGTRAGHWLGAETATASTAVAIKNLWQQFPKQLRVEEDRIVAALYSSAGTAAPLDLRIEALEEFWGPTMNEQIAADATLSLLRDRFVEDPTKMDPTGLSKTHELLIVTSGEPLDETLASAADAFAYGPLLMPTPGHTFASGVFGGLGPRSDERYPELEANTDALWDDIVTVIDDWGDYGFLTFGEGPHQHYLGFADGSVMANEWRYSMTIEYGFGLAAFMSFLRSGDRRIYDIAVANSRYNADIILPSVDGPRRVRGDYAWSPGFTLIPWQGIGKAQTHANTFGWLIERNLVHYYLTGDRRSLGAFEDYAARRKQLIEEAGGIEPWVSEMVATSFKNSSRGSFQRLNDLSVMYLQLGDPFFLEAADAVAEAFVVPENVGGIRYEPLAVGDPADQYPSYFFYKFRDILSYRRVTSDKDRVNAALVKMADWVYTTQADHYILQETRGFGRLMATAYELTDDLKYIAFGLRTIRRRHNRAIAPASEVPEGGSRDYRTVNFLPIQRFVSRTVPDGAVRLGSVLRGDNMALNAPYLTGVLDALDDEARADLYSAYSSGSHSSLPVFHNPMGFAHINPPDQTVAFAKLDGEALEIEFATNSSMILDPSGTLPPLDRFEYIGTYTGNLGGFSADDPDRQHVASRPLHRLRFVVPASEPAGDYRFSVTSADQLTVFAASSPAVILQ